METVHLQFLWIVGWHPQTTLACAAFSAILSALLLKCYLHSKTTFISLFCHEGFFFFNFYFQKPYTESISLLPLSSHHILFVASCYRVLSKGSPTLNYLSPAGGPGGEFLASCTLLVINMNFRGGMYST